MRAIHRWLASLIEKKGPTDSSVVARLNDKLSSMPVSVHSQICMMITMPPRHCLHLFPRVASDISRLANAPAAQRVIESNVVSEESAKIDSEVSQQTRSKRAEDTSGQRSNIDHRPWQEVLDRFGNLKSGSQERFITHSEKIDSSLHPGLGIHAKNINNDVSNNSTTSISPSVGSFDDRILAVLEEMRLLLRSLLESHQSQESTELREALRNLRESAHSTQLTDVKSPRWTAMPVPSPLDSEPWWKPIPQKLLRS